MKLAVAHFFSTFIRSEKNRMKEILSKPLFETGSFKLTPEMLLASTIVIGGTIILLIFIRFLLLRKADMSVSEKGRRNSFYLLIKYFLWVIAISFCIEIFGFKVTLLIAGSAALLVGLGFGLQNIFNDFISGLFLLFERTIKVGDVMEVGGIVGRVVNISLRTSVLHSRDGFDIIVPNHKFITDNVINWSHQSFTCRFTIDVGVAYQSDVDKVTEILLSCAREHPKVTKSDIHKPSVRLYDFGNSALEFQLLFWTEEIFRMENVKSELRYSIIRKFRSEGIVIPFPQRDVHFKGEDKK